jgi:DNA repair photolyase
MITRDLDSFTEGSVRPTMPEGSRIVECKYALSKSTLPGLDYALNPYVGCAHDCVYCFAPALLGADRLKWATEIGVRNNLPTLLAKEAPRKKGTVGLGTVTDPYQPIEGEMSLTRKCLEVLARSRLSLSVLTKSPLVTRDIDLLKRMSKAEIGVTITGYEEKLVKVFEPGAPSPKARLSAVKELCREGLDTYVMIGPVIPNVSDSDTEVFFAQIAATGVKRVMLDRMRLRPGLMERFHSLPVMMPEFRRDFDNNVGSHGYFKDFCLQAERLCSKLDLRLEQAF